MTSPAINTQTGIATGDTARLPEAGPFEALKHLHSQLMPETLKALSPEKLKDLSSELQKAEALLAAATLELRKQAFLDTYSVKVLDDGPHQVSFTIPEGKSRMDLIKDAHELAQALYNRPGVYPDRLATWQSDPQFTQAVTQATPAAIDGCVPHSTNKPRSEQEANGWNDVDIRDLAAAHQAFFVATGKDLFNGKVVRARGGALDFDSVGLVVYNYHDDNPSFDVAASRSLPLPN